MSVAPGAPPPPPPPRGPGRVLGAHNTPTRRRRVGEYELEGDSDDEGIEVVAVDGMPCTSCRRRTVRYGTKCDCQPGPGDACLPCNEKHYSCEKRDDVFAANPEARRAWRQFADFVSASVDNNNSHITTPGTRGLDPTRPNAARFHQLRRAFDSAWAASGRTPTPAKLVRSSRALESGPESSPTQALQPFSMGPVRGGSANLQQMMGQFVAATGAALAAQNNRMDRLETTVGNSLRRLEARTPTTSRFLEWDEGSGRARGSREGRPRRAR
ncbi:hypothetical protein E8E11_000008, partial [Didymella keratinophila]